MGDHQGVLGLVLAFVFTAILGFVLFVPTGPTTIVTETSRALGSRNRKLEVIQLPESAFQTAR